MKYRAWRNTVVEALKLRFSDIVYRYQIFKVFWHNAKHYDAFQLTLLTRALFIQTYLNLSIVRLKYSSVASPTI